MPVNYSKFDHIEDSDDEKPDPKAVEAADRRRELAEQLKARLAGSPVESSGKAAAAGGAGAEENRPMHQRDRFAHSEADVSKVAKEALKQSLLRSQAVKVGNGILSVVAVDKVEGDAMKAQIRGEDRHIFDFSFDMKVAFKWMGANFDAGMQRAEGLLKVCDFASESTLDSRDNAPSVAFTWTDVGSLDDRRRGEVEQMVGASTWPPPKCSLMAEVVLVLQTWVKKLPECISEYQARQRAEKVEEVQERPEDAQP